MRRLFFSALCCLAVAMTAASAAQANIVVAGSIIDTRKHNQKRQARQLPILPSMTEVTQFSNTDVAKTFDIDGDDRYGTDRRFPLSVLGLQFLTKTVAVPIHGQAPCFRELPTFTSEFANLIQADGSRRQRKHGEFPKCQWYYWFYPK